MCLALLELKACPYFYISSSYRKAETLILSPCHQSNVGSLSKMSFAGNSYSWLALIPYSAELLRLCYRLLWSSLTVEHPHYCCLIVKHGHTAIAHLDKITEFICSSYQSKCCRVYLAGSLPARTDFNLLLSANIQVFRFLILRWILECIYFLFHSPFSI